MASYTTTTSDKSKKKALSLLLMGGLGFHLFYVGKIRAGIIRFVVCFLFLSAAIGNLFRGECGGAFVGALIVVLCNISDLVKILLGTFRDNTGAPLRE